MPFFPLLFKKHKTTIISSAFDFMPTNLLAAGVSNNESMPMNLSKVMCTAHQCATISSFLKLAIALIILVAIFILIWKIVRSKR